MQFLHSKYLKCHLANIIFTEPKLMTQHIAHIVPFLHIEEEYYLWTAISINNG